MGIMDKVKTMAKRRVAKNLSVKSASNLSPNMRRVTLQGRDLDSLPRNAEGAYIKLMFDSGSDKPAMRTYTIASHRPEHNEIDVDFMLHGGSDGITDGIAAPWSMNTQTGDTISVFGPGPAKFINLDAEHFLLAADMTALPALTANLKKLPADAKGHAFIEIMSAEDRQNLQKPDGMELHWIVNDEPGSDESPLFHAIAQAPEPTTSSAAWIACEFKTMKKIRHFLKVERSMEKSHLYISSYWKKGNTEEQHKALKQDDEKAQSL